MMPDKGSRPSFAPRPADWVFLLYNFAVAGLVLLTYPRQPAAGYILAAHAVLIAASLLIIRADPARGFWGLLRVWYPFVTFVFIYMEAGLLRHGIFPADLDPLLVKAELFVFGVELYRILPPMIGTFGMEIIHAFYFSYYPLLYLPGLVAMNKKSRIVREYIFSLTLSMCVMCFFFMLVPSSGPKMYRADPVYDGFLFIPIMNLIYGNVDQGGAAFPSAHAAQAILLAFYTRLFFWRWRFVYYFFVVMILISTVLCSYHYAIDTLAGIILGFLFYALGRKLYDAYADDPRD